MSIICLKPFANNFRHIIDRVMVMEIEENSWFYWFFEIMTLKTGVTCPF